MNHVPQQNDYTGMQFVDLLDKLRDRGCSTHPGVKVGDDSNGGAREGGRQALNFRAHVLDQQTRHLARLPPESGKALDGV